jgi:predicted DsbA family dithiol-disulfide isomerase
MAELPRLAMYADLACPYAYIAAYRLRKLRDEYRGQLIVEHKSLALEYVNRQPTPKRVLDSECPILMLVEPELPCEAVKCAERQGPELADELDWAIRTAFFAESRCISMRHVLFELAEQIGLAMDRFTQDFDSGQMKALAVQEAREGWERLNVPGSPTFVLPMGRRIGDAADLGLPEVMVDEQGYGRVTGLQPAPCASEACLALYRRIIEETIAHP